MKHVSISRLLLFVFSVLFCATGVGFVVDAQAAGIGCGVGGAAANPANPQGIPCGAPPTPAQLNDPALSPNANKGLGAACDANFMNQIYAKAFIEAEREMVITNSTITKPDSVLEYSCFDYLAARVATIAGPVFSERPWIMNVNTSPNMVPLNVSLGNTHLDRSIEQLVLASLDAYGDKNFPYDFLAGAAAGDNHDFSPTVAGAAGVCDHMFNMHFLAKCGDFGLSVPFMTFENYFSVPALLNTDPRTNPKVCPAAHQITPLQVEIAKNAAWNWASFDRVDTYLSSFRAADDTNCQNATPIPTGVMVKQAEYAQDIAGNPIMGAAQFEYQDKVCSNPACYFDNKGNANPADDVCKAVP